MRTRQVVDVLKNILLPQAQAGWPVRRFRRIFLCFLFGRWGCPLAATGVIVQESWSRLLHISHLGSYVRGVHPSAEHLAYQDVEYHRVAAACTSTTQPAVGCRSASNSSAGAQVSGVSNVVVAHHLVAAYLRCSDRYTGITTTESNHQHTLPMFRRRGCRERCFQRPPRC